MSKCRNFFTLSVAVLAVLCLSLPAVATTFYLPIGGTGRYIYDPANWNTNPAGGGTVAVVTDFDSVANSFIIDPNKAIRIANPTSGVLNFTIAAPLKYRGPIADSGTNAAYTFYFNGPNGSTTGGAVYTFNDLKFTGTMFGATTRSPRLAGKMTLIGDLAFQFRTTQNLDIDAEVDGSAASIIKNAWYVRTDAATALCNIKFNNSNNKFYGTYVLDAQMSGTVAGSLSEGDFIINGAYTGTTVPDFRAGLLTLTNGSAISSSSVVKIYTNVGDGTSTNSAPARLAIAGNAVTIRELWLDGVKQAGTPLVYTTASVPTWLTVTGAGSLTVTNAATQNLTMALDAGGDPNVKTAPPAGLTKAFAQGRAVKIYAPNPTTSPYSFAYWTSSVPGAIASETSASTTVTIPTGSDITVTAHYIKAASYPSPLLGATGVSVFTGLSWTPVLGVATQQVLFDTVNPPVAQIASGNGSLVSLPNSQLNGGARLADSATYYWQIVSDASGGTVWQFTTGSSVPRNPSPADAATERDPNNFNLTWQADAAATSFDVYFSTNQSLVSSGDVSVKSTVATASFPVPQMTRGITYYWKVTANYAGGISTTGPVWSFRVKTYKLYLKTGSTTVGPRYSIDGAADVNTHCDDANVAVYKFAGINYNSQWDIVVTGSKGAAIWTDADFSFNGAFDVSGPHNVAGATAGVPLAHGYAGQDRAADATTWADVALSGPGRGTKKINTWPGGGGGGYGGIGGDYGFRDTTGGWGGVAYGEQQLYTLWGGSGGGAGLECPGGSGGGIIEIYAKGNVTLGSNSAVRSDGGNGLAVSRTGSGGGSGGSVRVVALGNVSVAGAITANGGKGCDATSNTNQGGGGGGGGRIAIYHGGAYSATGSVTAAGGLRGNVATTNATDGAAGTVFTSGAAVTLMTANNQYPANNAIGVSFSDPNYDYVAWNPALGSTTNTLYFGTNSVTMSPVATYTDANGLRLRRVYRPVFAQATQYYWRVDTNGVTGALMTFRTKGFEATTPNPADGATGVDVHNPRLSWQMYTPSATKWEVYFGTSQASLNLKKTITDPNALKMYYDAGELLASRTYYWRVDETSNIKWTGFVWSFTTRAATLVPPADKPIADLSGDCKVSFIDMALLASHWKVCNLYPLTDCQ